MAAAADRLQRLGHVERRGATARGDEDTVLHLGQQDEGVAVGQVHGLVNDEADALDVSPRRGRPRPGRRAGAFDRPCPLEHVDERSR